LLILLLSEVSCFDRIWETTIPRRRELLRSLQEHLDPLRRTTRHNSSVVNIIDPYSHALMYGHTLVRFPDDEIKTMAPPQFSEHNYAISSNSACIPTLFSISDAQSTVCAISYINGIPPSMPSLYANVEIWLASSIPLFEHVLTDLHRSNLLPHRIPGTCKYTTWDEPLTPEHSDDEEGWTEYQKEMREWALSRPIQHPDVPETGYPGSLQYRKSRVSLSRRNLKVIVKAIDIKLVSRTVVIVLQRGDLLLESK
jgi:hypothetical protein